MSAAKKTMKERKMGIYDTKKTRDELELSVRQIHKKGFEAEEVLTLIHQTGQFNVYNKMEFLGQLRQWKDMKCVLLDCNVWEKTIAGKTMWAFVVQPLKIEGAPGVCPLAVALNILVSGFTYVCKSKETADLVLRVLRPAPAPAAAAAEPAKA
jgi:hypothetical protein